MQHKNVEKFNIIIDFINRYYENCGNSPTTREIAEGTGISRPTVQRYLADMRDKGMIEYSGHRNIVTGFMRNLSSENTSLTGLYGSIACGELSDAAQEITEYVRLPKQIFGKGQLFMLRTYGDSMIEAGINSGDIVVIRKEINADYDDIVAVLYEGQTTLKRYRPQKDKIILHPENKEMDDIVLSGENLSSFRIQGILTHVIKEADYLK